ncbi:MAG: tRNA (N6-threonylcarbamoyladenosine(37)-N6)-methyltransferase TrmO [Candidatus Thorarchaeota archaeon]
MSKDTEFLVKSIGVIRTPFKSSEDTPIQSSKSDVKGHVDIASEYLTALKSLDGFSHIILVYWFHRAKNPKMQVKPFLDKEEHGLFSIRAPSRPNPIGISIVKLIGIEGTRLDIEGVDMLDMTPLLDIKPFIPEFDNRPQATSGWLAKSSLVKNHSHIADSRFEK